MRFYKLIMDGLDSHRHDEKIQVVTIPDLSFTPKEILEKFTTSSLNLNVHEPTDSHIVETDENGRVVSGEFVDDVYYPEDEFDLNENCQNVIQNNYGDIDNSNNKQSGNNNSSTDSSESSKKEQESDSSNQE